MEILPPLEVTKLAACGLLDFVFIEQDGFMELALVGINTDMDAIGLLVLSHQRKTETVPVQFRYEDPVKWCAKICAGVIVEVQTSSGRPLGSGKPPTGALIVSNAGQSIQLPSKPMEGARVFSLTDAELFYPSQPGLYFSEYAIVLDLPLTSEQKPLFSFAG